MNDNAIFEPLELYNSTLKDKFNDEANIFFDALLKASEVDEALNAETVKKYDNTNKKYEEAKSHTGKAKGLKAFLIVLAIIGAIVALIGGVFTYFTYLEKGSYLIPILLIIGDIALLVSMILVICLKLNGVIKKRLAQQQRLEKEKNNLLNECYRQVSPLCALFDWNMPAKIMRKATPILEIDDYFDISKFNYLNKKYGFSDIKDKDTSTVCVLSGSIVGNPFLVVRNFHTFQSSKTYTGSLTISWQEREVDSEGRVRYVTRTQTLVAHLNKPAPAYEYNTYLVYGNDAAPDLNFSRSPSGMKGKDEKDIDKHVQRQEDDLVRYADKAVAQGKSFTPMSNTEFEILFGALNRDNEVQFRLLFTPLAQKSELQLIKSKEPYGDDFYFEKKGPLNFIVSQHSQNNDIYANPYNFKHYDVKALKTIFVNYANEYFKGLFFDLAPLLSIPLYQQHKPVEYIYDKMDKYNRNYTNYEEETLANAFDTSIFAHPNSVTRPILKTEFINKKGKSDIVNVKAHTFKTIQRLEYVPTMGGDGHMHNVPVYWDEYIPLQKDTIIGVRANNITRYEYDNNINIYQGKGGINGAHTFQRGLFAFVTSENFSDENEDELAAIFSYNKKENKEEN